MYKGFLLNSSDLPPKILPQAIKSIEILEGDGGVGTIKKVNFADGSQFKIVKQRVEFVDNLTYSYSIIEGDALMNNLEAISYHFTVVPTDDGGCIVKNTLHLYHQRPYRDYGGADLEWEREGLTHVQGR